MGVYTILKILCLFLIVMLDDSIYNKIPPFWGMCYDFVFASLNSFNNEKTGIGFKHISNLDEHNPGVETTYMSYSFNF